ncbi:MAG: hypothetical protein H3C36_02385 [Chitinophagaceae bacterium]|nr:hypothetical protein [Chitinophagaceae bacterium]
MEYLTLGEIKQRISVLNRWLKRNHEDHFQYSVVKAERNHYDDLADEMEDAGISVKDVNCATQCYELIIREEL